MATICNICREEFKYEKHQTEREICPTCYEKTNIVYELAKTESPSLVEEKHITKYGEYRCCICYYRVSARDMLFNEGCYYCHFCYKDLKKAADICKKILFTKKAFEPRDNDETYVCNLCEKYEDSTVDNGNSGYQFCFDCTSRVLNMYKVIKKSSMESPLLKKSPSV